MITPTNSLIRRIAFPACVVFSPVAAVAAYTSIGGSPSGDPFAGVDWNLTNNTGAPQFRNGFTSGALRGFDSLVIGNQTGAALSSAATGDLLAAAYKEVTRTANQAGVNNTTSLPASASAAFGDRLTFAGTGTSFSFTLTPDVRLATADLGFDFGEGQPILASVERNFVTIEAEVLIYYEVRNANNTTAYTINQGAYERLNASGLFESRGRFADFTFQDIAPVEFTLTAGQTLLISGSVYSAVSVFSSIDAGPGAADAVAGLELSLGGITAGWDYTTDSGSRLPAAAIPEPSSFAVLCGLVAFGLAARRRGRA